MYSKEHLKLKKMGLSSVEILESITDAFYAVDADWRLTYVNYKTELWWNRRREELLGTILWNVFPEIKQTDWIMHKKAARERITLHWETYCPILNTWFDVNAYPTPDGGALPYIFGISPKQS